MTDEEIQKAKESFLRMGLLKIYFFGNYACPLFRLQFIPKSHKC